MGDDTLYTYTGDASSVIETFDEISSGIRNLMEDFQALVDAASELTMIEDVIAGLANELDLLDGTATGAVAALGDVAVASDEAATSLQTLGASSEEVVTLTAAMDEMSAMTRQGAADAATLDETMTTVGTGAADVTAQVDGLNSVIAQMSTTITEDTAIISGLNEQIANLEGQLSVLTTEEEGTTEGAGGLAAMMGTVGEVATGLGDQLQAVMGPLMMVGTIAALAGGQLIGMGLSGQKGEVLLRGMAGASQADINALQTDALSLGVTMDQASAGFYEVESAGYAGSQAITVFDAASRLALGGAANQQDVMSGLTAIMHDYTASADDATKYTDYMAEAVLRGKQSMQDFSANIGPLASAGENVGISFDQVAAAEATMTQISPKVGLDAQQLTSLFKFLSPTMGGVEKAAKGLGLAFDEQKYSSLDLLGKLQYLSDISGGTSTAAFSKLTGGVRGSTAAIDLLKNNAQAFKDNLDAMGHSAGATANAFSQYEDSIPGHLDKASAALSIFGTRLMDALGPKVGPIIDNITAGIGHMADFILAHTDLIGPVLAGLAAIIGVVLVGAVVSFVAASWPIILILTAIGAAAAATTYAVTHWSEIMGAIHSNPVLNEILHVLQQVGGYIASLFIPIWQQLVSVWQAQLVPAFMQLWQSIQPLLPALKLLGEIIGGGIVISIILLVAQISALLSAFAGMLPGLIRVFGGIVQVISGAIQIIIGIISFFTDLFTGKWSKLGGDLSAISQGIVTMFTGFWNIVAGLFQAATGFIGGLISGFATVIVGILQDMGVQGVNHILDMINGIVSWFEQLPGRAGAFILQLIGEGVAHFINFNVQSINLALSLVNGFISQIAQMPGRVAGVFNSLVSTALGILNGLASSALGAGAHIVEQIASGILGAIGGVLSNAMASIGNFISSHLPSSPAKVGPLKELLQQGSMITEQVSTGMLSNLPKLQDALKQMTNPIALNLNPSTLAPNPSSLPTGPTGAQAGGSNQTTQYLAQMVSLLAQIVQLQQRQSGTTQQNLTFNASSGGTISPQQLYQIMQSLSGYSYEGVQRGAL